MTQIHRAYFLVRHGSSTAAFEMREIPERTPSGNEVLIEVEASGLNFADVMARQGLYGDAPPLPSILGYEVVGRIAGVGSEVRDTKTLRVGARVLAFTRFGGYSSHVVTSENAVVAIPDSMDAVEATALATQGCTAWYCAEEMVRIFPGDRVLVQAAAGGVGSLLVQLAKRRGATVYGTAGSNEKLERLKEIGLDVGVNYREQEFEKVVPRGMDVIFDSLGGSAVAKGTKLLRAGGRMVCFGAAEMSGDRKNPLRILKTVVGFGLPLAPISMMMNSRCFIGVNMLKVGDEKPEVLKRCMTEVVALASRGELKTLATRRFPVAEIAAAHDLLGSRGSMGKVALIW